MSPRRHSRPATSKEFLVTRAVDLWHSCNSYNLMATFSPRTESCNHVGIWYVCSFVCLVGTWQKGIMTDFDEIPRCYNDTRNNYCWIWSGPDHHQDADFFRLFGEFYFFSHYYLKHINVLWRNFKGRFKTTQRAIAQNDHSDLKLIFQCE